MREAGGDDVLVEPALEILLANVSTFLVPLFVCSETSEVSLHDGRAIVCMDTRHGQTTCHLPGYVCL
jgi:hypothetical protein